MIKGIHHISAFTKSATANHHFYTEILGLRFVKNTVNQQNTKIRHLFYGDYQGNPGTLLTFFEYKNIGHAYNENNYFSTVFLNVPKGSLPYWESRLNDYSIVTEYNSCKQTLAFEDDDSLPLAFIEVDETILPENATRHSDVPIAYQIIDLAEASLRVESPEKTLTFLTDFLDLAKTKAIGQVTDAATHFLTTVKPSNSTAVTRMGRGTIDHIAYSVDSPEALKTLHQKAEELQLDIELYVERGYFKSLYIKEPNHLRIEIATEEPGFTLDESVEELGKNFSLPPFLENKRAEIEAHLEEF